MNPDVLLSHLLDKYEKSKHLLQPNSSTRRVMLRIEKKEFLEYRYEDAQNRDAWNKVIKELEERELILTEWVKGRPVLSAVVLNLEHVMECYQMIGRTHPIELARTVEDMVSSKLSCVTTDWIIAWRNDICTQARKDARIPSYCRKDLSLLSDLLTAFAVYDTLHGESVTMRAFSSKCYQNTKTFEYEIRDIFLKIASEYAPDLVEASKQEELGDRDRLACLGIYARPELYEMTGNCTIQTMAGDISFAAAVPYGLALPSTAIDGIISVDLSAIQTILLIENKTNYDEFLLSELGQHQLVIYHGGFLSPQKQKFFRKIAQFAPQTVQIYFWADIDLGGFQMFERLQRIFPALIPMRMSAGDIETYHTSGLQRSKQYLSQVEAALEEGRFPAFHGAMRKILEYGVTIEQEVFLTQ